MVIKITIESFVLLTCRLETHLMMSLSYGKVTADTARLALANQVIQVS